MIIILPFILSIILNIIIEKEEILYYGILSTILLCLNIKIPCGEILVIVLLSLSILYWILNNDNKILGMIFLLGSILGILSTSIYSFYIAIEILSFIMIIIINLYVQDQYSGIIYYILSGILSIFLILSLSYIYIGNEIGYKIFYIVLLSKLGFIPFHIILINIYNNISISIILLIDILYKFVLFIFLYRIYWISININWIIILLLLFGSIGSLYYNNLLSILIYSSLYHYGLILILLKYQYWEYFIYYLFIYMIIVFLYLYLITSKYINQQVLNSYYILIWSLLIINLIGIPPFQGFWIKLYPIYLIIYESSYLLFIIITFGILLLSYTYLRILLSILLSSNITSLYTFNPYFSHLISSLIILICL